VSEQSTPGSGAERKHGVDGAGRGGLVSGPESGASAGPGARDSGEVGSHRVTGSLPYVFYRPPVLVVVVVAGFFLCPIFAGLSAALSLALGSSTPLWWPGLLVAASVFWWMFPTARITSDHLEVPRFLNHGQGQILRSFPARARRRRVPRAAVAGFRVGRKGNLVGVVASLRGESRLAHSATESRSLWLLTDARSFGLPRVDRVAQTCITMCELWGLARPDADGLDVRVRPDPQLLDQKREHRSVGAGGRGLEVSPDGLTVTAQKTTALLPWSKISSLTDARVVEVGEPDRWMLRADLRDGRTALIDRQYWGTTGPSDDDLVWLVTLAERSGVTCQVTGTLHGVPMMSRRAANEMIRTLTSLALDPARDGSDQ